MKMHEKKLKKFKVYKVIANVLFYVVLIAGVIGILVALAGVTMLAVNNIDLAEGLNSFISMIDVNFEVPVEKIPYALIFLIITGISVIIALAAYLFKTTSNLFGNIVKTETPFHEGTIRRLKNMGIALFVYTAITAVLTSVTSGMMANVIMHPGFDMNISVDISTIFFGVLLFALAEIFEFGASLQEDSESIV